MQCDPETGVLVVPEWRKGSETEDEILKVLCSYWGDRKRLNGRIPHLGPYCPASLSETGASFHGLRVSLKLRSLRFVSLYEEQNFVFDQLGGFQVVPPGEGFAKTGRELP